MKQFDIKKGKDDESEGADKSATADKKEKMPEIKAAPKQETKEKGSLWPYFLGLLIGLIVVLGVLWFTTRSANDKSKTEEAATTENANVNANENANTNANENANANTNSSATATTLDKTKYTLQIQNGNGVAGDASKVKAILEKDGWTVKSVANANNFNYANTMVYYKTADEEAAKAVADVLKTNNRQTSMHESTTIKYNVVIILGKT